MCPPLQPPVLRARGCRLPAAPAGHWASNRSRLLSLACFEVMAARHRASLRVAWLQRLVGESATTVVQQLRWKADRVCRSSTR
jgi:hypothetical protein